MYSCKMKNKIYVCGCDSPSDDLRKMESLENLLALNHSLSNAVSANKLSGHVVLFQKLSSSNRLIVSTLAVPSFIGFVALYLLKDLLGCRHACV